MSRSYQGGDRVLLVDRKQRRYLVTLEPGAEFHSHTGVVAHDDLIGCEDGGAVNHPQVSELFISLESGRYVPRNQITN